MTALFLILLFLVAITLNIFLISPVIAYGMVYVGSEDYKIYALNATTGALVWSYMTGDVVVSTLAVADGVVYVGSYDHVVYAFGSL